MKHMELEKLPNDAQGISEQSRQHDVSTDHNETYGLHPLQSNYAPTRPKIWLNNWMYINAPTSMLVSRNRLTHGAD